MTSNFDRPKQLSYIVLNAEQILTHPFPPRESIIGPICTQSLNMVHAWRGVGKTHFALGLAFAIATGGEFLGWKADRPRTVLYIDGELSGHMLKERLARLVEASGLELEPGRLRFITPDAQKGSVPNLSDPDSQAALDALLEGVEVIIPDNLSCLAMGTERENDGESWNPILTWALRMRREGRTVLFVHHSNKGGSQRGTSKKEDVLDVVLILKRPPGYSPTDGARFEVHFEKARGLAGDDQRPFLAILDTDAAGKQAWITDELDSSTFDRVVEMTNLDLTPKDISQELGVNKSTVCRHLKKAREEGLIREREQ